MSSPGVNGSGGARAYSFAHCQAPGVLTLVILCIWPILPALLRRISLPTTVVESELCAGIDFKLR